MMGEPRKLSYDEVVELLQSGIGVPGVPIYNPPACTNDYSSQQCTIESLLELKKQFQHQMCRCTLNQPPQFLTEINELGCKLSARIVLSDHTPKIILPSNEEWLGVNLLERDDDLPPRIKVSK